MINLLIVSLWLFSLAVGLSVLKLIIRKETVWCLFIGEQYYMNFFYVVSKKGSPRLFWGLAITYFILSVLFTALFARIVLHFVFR
jgi:hypothetical protein